MTINLQIFVSYLSYQIGRRESQVGTLIIGPKRVRCKRQTPIRLMAMICVYCAVWVTIASAGAKESSERRFDFHIEAHSLGLAMDAFAEQGEVQLLYPYDLAQTPGLHPVIGQYTIREALNIMFESTDFSAGLTEKGTVMVSYVMGNQNQEKEKKMASGKIKTSLLAGVATALFGVSGVRAQDEDRAQVSRDTIIVTATKREQRLQDVPISIRAIGGEEIKKRGIETLLDLQMAVPGLSVLDSGTFQRRIYLRGFGNITGSQAIVGLYLDDVPLSGGSISHQFDLRMFDLERVEVLKGPQGTLYGQGSVGGTIRYITKSPDLTEYSGVLDATASFTEDGAPSQKIQGVVNLPLVKDKLGLRVVGTFENSGGWIDQPTVGQEDINDQNVTNVRAKLLWTPTDALEVSALANIYRNNPGAPSVGEDEDGNFTQVLGQALTPSGEESTEIFNLSVKYDFGAFEALSSTSYAELDKELFGLKTGQPGADILYNFVLADTQIFTEEVRLSSKDESRIQWTVGGFYQDVEYNDAFTADVGGEGGDETTIFLSFASLSANTSESWSVFGELGFQFGRLEIGGGVRYYEDSRTNLTAGVFEEGNFDALSPRAYVKFDATDDFNFYGSVGKGFRSGGFNLFGTPPFDPETTWSYEVGAKGSLFDGALSGDVAIFLAKSSDFQQTGTPTDSFFAGTFNVGDVEIKGVDWAFSLHANNALTFVFNGNYVDTKFTSIDAVGTDKIVGDPLDFIPEYQFDIGAIYDFDLAARPANFRIDYSQRGGSTTKLPTLGIDAKSEPISLLNASLDLNWTEGVSVGVFANNLLNERDYVDANFLQFISPRPRPRTYGVRMNVEF